MFEKAIATRGPLGSESTVTEQVNPGPRCDELPETIILPKQMKDAGRAVVITEGKSIIRGILQCPFSIPHEKLELAGRGSPPRGIPVRGAIPAWAEKIEPAMAAESARWGDYRRDVHPYKEGPYALYTPREYWRPEVMRLLEEYFPKRTGLFLNQLEAENLPLSPGQKE